MGARTLIALLGLAACAGPSPRVERAVVSTSPEPGHTRIEVDVANRGGAGEIELDIHLHDRRSGADLRESRHVQIGRDQRLEYVTDIATPPGDWAADVGAQYPD